MDLVSKLMNPNTPVQKIYIRNGEVDGVLDTEMPDDDEHQECVHSHSEGYNIEYVEEYQREEEELYSEMSRVREDEPDQDGTMTLIDGATDMLSPNDMAEVEQLKYDQLNEAYEKYNFNTYRSQKLVIDDYREKIISLINTNDTVVIEGPTGCGKTTQVPQFILDDCKANNKHCRIVVTQPRRIAAITVARRVCEERNWGLGTICGYQVGLEVNLSGDTLLQYMTTGVLLQKLIRQKNLHEYTHIIVDEVHERNQDMDFLLLIIRRFLNTNSMDTKVILMSATFDANVFSVYFKSYSRNSYIPASVISVSKTSTQYNTQIYFAEQLVNIRPIPSQDIADPKIEPARYELLVLLILAFDRLDHINPLTKQKITGNVLVFLPGIYEIEEAHAKLESIKQNWEILPLHSSITIEEQRKVFRAPTPGYRKIILSTNIAESSITVPDIVYVVDFCLTKTMIVDPDTQYQSLQLQWASHVSCTQRAGRVGRVSDGRVYRLVTRDFYENYLPQSVQPEMLRAPLNQVILKAKLLDLNQPPKAILALAMDPPELSKIDSAILFLKEIGGLSMKCGDVKSTIDGDITFLGIVMASLPLNVLLSKFILLGHLYSCLEDSIIMATGCSLNIFKSPFKERFKAYVNRLMWADGSASDLIAHRNMYKVYQNKKRMNNNRVLLEWCRTNCVSLRSLKEWSILVKEIQERLARMHIRQNEGPGSVVLSNTELPTVIKVVICGAFYPHYFKRSADGGQVDEREAVKTLGGRDPCNTVFFTGFDPQQPGPLYANLLKNKLRDCGTHMEVGFDGSSKVYIQFTNPQHVEKIRVDGEEYSSGMPGKIRTDVYRAVRLRQLKIPITIPVLEKEDAWELARRNGLRDFRELALEGENNVDTEEETSAIAHAPVIPGLDVEFVHIAICERIDCGHFWAHNVDQSTEDTLYQIENTLASEKLKKLKPENVKIDGIYAAQYEKDKRFYRCKVISKIAIGSKQDKVAQIIFIDYGTPANVYLDNLYELPQHDCMSSPAQAMECYLSKIQPSAVANPRALWSAKADMAFNQQTEGNTFYGKVYSVVQGIVHLELYKNKSVNPIFENSLNNWLIEKGYAQPAEEGFLSKENNQKRAQLALNPEKLSAFMIEESLHKVNVQDVEPPDSRMCPTTISLRGPCSPLEMKIYSVVASGATKQVSIDGNSVNTVLLDTNPEDPHERLIVAAYIGQNASATNLFLRHTTVMPNIHGFPMLMSLLFCPTMETKPTKDGSRFGAILCGLGACDDGVHAIYPPHDICLTLDTDLNEEDLNMINKLRYWMNVAVESMKANYQEIPLTTTVTSCQRELKRRLFDLLKKPRKSVERVFLPNANIWGKCLYYSELLKPGESFVQTEIWPLHSAMQLNRKSEKQVSLEAHLIELEEINLRMRSQNSNVILCKFCDITVNSAAAMRVHVSTNEHLKNVKAGRYICASSNSQY